MCYSAQIRADYKKYVRKWGADISLKQYFQLYWERRADAKINENVSRHKMEGRELVPGENEENVILEFRPNTAENMLVACLLSLWQGARTTGPVVIRGDHRRASS